jgi:hypothetical protein
MGALLGRIIFDPITLISDVFQCSDIVFRLIMIPEDK